MNITDTIWAHGRQSRGTAAIIAQGQTVSYGQLCEGAELIGHHLVNAGVVCGDFVALSLRNPLIYLTATLALARMGAAVLPLPRAWTSEMKDELIRRHGVRTLVQDDDDGWQSAAAQPARSVRLSTLIRNRVDGEATRAQVQTAANELPWMVRLTSGTTGTPKSVVQTHEQGLFHIKAIGNTESSRRVLVFLDLQVGFGLANALRTLLDGRTLILSGDLRPAHFFQLVSSSRPDTVYMSTGTAALVTAQAEKTRILRTPPLDGIETVTVAGSAVLPSLRERFAKCICPNLRMVFGASETGPITLMTPDDVPLHANSSGRIHPWIKAEAVDPETLEPLPRGASGLLRFRSPMMAHCYAGDPEATERTFKQGWFYSGDTGLIDPDGYLVVHGRIDDRLNLGGNKVDASQIESILLRHPGIADCAVVAVDVKGMTFAVAALVTRQAVDAGSLRTLCERELGPSASLIRFATVRELPRNDGGKILRTQLAQDLSQAIQRAKGNPSGAATA